MDEYYVKLILKNNSTKYLVEKKSQHKSKNHYKAPSPNLKIIIKKNLVKMHKSVHKPLTQRNLDEATYSLKLS